MVKLVVVSVLLALLPACEEQPSDVQHKDAGLEWDAGLRCALNGDCPYPQFCVSGRCISSCDGTGAEFVCNSGLSDYPAECCPSGYSCCPAGFEYESCRAGPCPVLTYCPHQTEVFDVCPGDAFCLYEAPSADAGIRDGGVRSADGGLDDAGIGDGGADDGGAGDSGPSDGGVAEPGAACILHDHFGCVDECPTEDICGETMSQCCGEGTHCEQDCCVLD